MATTTKPYDRKLPFTRINSPSENLAPTRLSGDGHTRGTRRTDDFYVQALIDYVVRRLILLTPSWTTTQGGTERQAEQEIQGKLARSFQTWTDAPPFQWHRWYDWNFHLEPDLGEGGNLGYDWLRGLANATTTADELPPIVNHNPFNTDPTGRNQHVVFGRVMECEWDTGSFASATMQRPGPMFDADWAWPMANQRVWLVGRSIYDGGHETHGLCRSELHPCKAVATARWEAFNFKENNGGKAGGSVNTPALQFMFFTSRFGGYVDYPDLRPANGQPYEFIVELPEAPELSKAHLAVGGTPDTAMNTVVVRSNQLLKDFDRARFANTKNGGSAADVDPIVELLPEDPDHPRQRQAKVTIPLAALTGDCYGVLISLGWRDLNGEQAAKVKKCTVKFTNLHKGWIDHDTFSEEWRLKAGVNGRWFQWELTGVRNDHDYSLLRDEKNRETKREIWLHEDDALQFAAHGAELDLVDDVYMGSNSDRTISISNDDVNEELAPGDGRLSSSGTRRPVDWRTQVDIRPPATRTPGSYPVQRAIVRRIFNLMWDTLNDQNDPLGLIDAVVTAPSGEQPHNPLPIKSLVGKGERAFSLTAFQTWEEGDTAELLERPHRTAADASTRAWIDYRIDFTVTVVNQK